MSLNQTSDEDDDDDFGDAISIVHGITPSKTPGKKGTWLNSVTEYNKISLCVLLR